MKGLTLKTYSNTPKQVGPVVGVTDNFYTNFNKIQLAAAQLVAIQETTKQKGSFNEEDNKYYADSLLELGIAAQKLAGLQHARNVSILDYLNNNNNNIIKESPIENDSLPVSGPKKEASVAESKPIGEFYKRKCYSNNFYPHIFSAVNSRCWWTSIIEAKCGSNRWSGWVIRGCSKRYEYIFKNQNL